jgi:hypothetical protein
LLELHRSAITETAFAWLQSKPFRYAEFELSPTGIVRLGPGAARELAGKILRAIPMRDYVASARRLASWF